MEGLGGAVLRVQSGIARDSDLYLILGTLLSNERFLSDRTGAIGQLVGDIPLLEREDLCRSMAIILLTDFSPRVPMQDRARGAEVRTTPAFARYCAPPPRGVWERSDHLKGKYHKKGKVDVVWVSPYLRDVLMAIERMWNVSGHLVKTSAHLPISS